jgi:hypothetical protein
MCIILSTIYNFISVSVCIDMGLSALLWPGPILLTRRPWPYVIHHLHFMNIYRLYQQNQCLKIKNYAVYNIHRLAWGSFAFGTTGQLSIVPIHKTALRTVTLILIMFILYNLVTDNFKEYDFDTEYCLNIYITPLLCFFQ